MFLIHCVWGIDIKNWNVILIDSYFDKNIVSFPIFSDYFWFEVYIVIYLDGYITLFLMRISLEYLFETHSSEVMPILDVDLWFLDVAKGWICYNNLSLFYYETKTIDIERYQWRMIIDSCYFVVGGGVGGGAIALCVHVCMYLCVVSFCFPSVSLFISCVSIYIVNLLRFFT